MARLDLAQFATKQNADSGVWFPVTDVYDGMTLPIDLKIIGDDSDILQQHQREQRKKYQEALISSAGGKKQIEQDDSDPDEDVYLRIVDIRGWAGEGKDRKPVDELVLNDRAIKNDKESIKYLIEQMPVLKSFVRNKSMERANFLTKPPKN